MKKKKQNNGYDETLKEIYKDIDGEMPDMTRLDKSKKSFIKKFLYIAIPLLVITLTAWSGFFLLSGKNSFSSKQVAVNIKAPFNIISGENIEYNITVTNNELVELKNNTLNVKFPNGFIFKDANYNLQQDDKLFDNAMQNNYNTRLPNISPESEIEIIIKGQMIGELGYLPTISTNFKYSPGEFSTEYEINTSFDSQISDSLLKLTSDYKNQIINDTQSNIQFSIKNLNKVSPMENIKIEIDAPESFVDVKILKNTTNPVYVANDQPESSEEIGNMNTTTEYVDLDQTDLDRFERDKELLINGIASNNTLSYKLIGNFNVKENVKEVITIRAFIKDAKGDYNLQTQETMEFQIINGEILNTLIINGSSDNQAVNFGDKLNYLINVKNKSKAALSNLQIRAVFDSDILDYNSIIDDNKGTQNKNQILWTSKDVTGLALLLPEEEVEINISINTKSFENVKNLNQEKFQVISFFETTINQIDGVDVTKKSTSNNITNDFNTNLQFFVKGIYFGENGASIGTGPIPPIAGQKTTYQILTNIDNTIHELKDIKMTATLPSNVAWEYDSNVDAGNLNYNSNSIVWTINRMPNTIKTLNGLFKLSITPSVNDVNKILTLLNDIKIEATDVQTNNVIKLEISPITTKISDDPSGLVQAIQ